MSTVAVGRFVVSLPRRYAIALSRRRIRADRVCVIMRVRANLRLAR